MKTRKRRSALELATIEAKVTKAFGDDALVHWPDGLKTAMHAFFRISGCHAKGDYDTVFAATELLKQRLDQVITVSRIESVNLDMDACEQTVAKLKARGAAQQRPEELKIAERLLAEAKAMFANNNYDGAKDKVRELRTQLGKISGSQPPSSD